VKVKVVQEIDAIKALRVDLITYETSNLPRIGECLRITSLGVAEPSKDIREDEFTHHSQVTQLLWSLQYKEPAVKEYAIVDIIHGVRLVESKKSFLAKYLPKGNNWYEEDPLIEEQTIELVVRPLENP
jgi:hypothetical protein